MIRQQYPRPCFAELQPDGGRRDVTCVSASFDGDSWGHSSDPRYTCASLRRQWRQIDTSRQACGVVDGCCRLYLDKVHRDRAVHSDDQEAAIDLCRCCWLRCASMELPAIDNVMAAVPVAPMAERSVKIRAGRYSYGSFVGRLITCMRRREVVKRARPPTRGVAGARNNG